MKRNVLVLLITVLALSGCATTKVEKFEIVDFGIYSNEIDIKHADNKIYNIEEPKLTEETDRIPALVGTHFGFRFNAVGTPEGRKVSFIQQLEYPEIIDPKTGIKHQKNSFKRRIELSTELEDVRFFGYIFENEWELAPGNWIFSILYENEIVIEKKFVIYKP